MYTHIYVLYKPHNLPRLDSGFAVGSGLELGDSEYPIDEDDNMAECIHCKLHIYIHV